METITSLKDNSKKVKVDLMQMSIKRNNTSGITLKIKSQKFANFFKNNQETECSQNVKVSGLTVPQVLRKPNLSRACTHFYQFQTTCSSLKTSDGEPNLTFLLEKRIGDGVEFEITGRFSVEAMNDFKAEFKKEVTKFYIENMQQISIELDISVLEKPDVEDIVQEVPIQSEVTQ